MLAHLDHFLSAFAAFIAVISVFLPWIWRWANRVNVTYKFSSDMANNHLPHLYRGQRAIAKKLGVDLDDDPIIKFLDVDEKK